jgi:hypothetical protein
MKRTSRPGKYLGLGLALLLLAEWLPAATIPAQRGTADPDGKTVWYDGTLLDMEGKGWAHTESCYDRLPAKAKDTVPRAVWNLSHQTAGLCFRFTTDADSVQVRWVVRNKTLAMPHMPATGVSGIDLYGKDAKGVWCFLRNGRPENASNTASFDMTPGQECLLYLPLYNGVKSLAIGIPRERTLSTPNQGRGKPIVFYGTSITQGGCASRPGLACTAIVGRRLDVPVINLGFSGSGKMEPALADLLVELDPSVYVLDCLWNMTPEMTKTRVEPFVKKLRAARPKTPILLVADSSFQNVTPTEKGRILRESYENLKRQGVKRLHLLSNEDMLGRDFEGTVDGCHPNDLGMMRQAEVFVEALRPILPTATTKP